MIAALEPGDVLTVTRLDRLARSTRDLLNTLVAITGNERASAESGTATRGSLIVAEPAPQCASSYDLTTI